jgi:endonuclease G
MNIQNILQDSSLFEEMESRLSSSKFPSRFPSSRSPEVTKSIIWGIKEGTQYPDFETESIVRRFGRPVLFIQKDTFEPPQSEVWLHRLASSRSVIEQAIPAVGRVELREHPGLAWNGTAWLVSDNIVVTNRHVAEDFAQREGVAYTFKRNFRGRNMMARIDFAEEFNQPEQEEYAISEVLYIEESSGYDIAFMRLSAPVHDVTPIKLANTVKKGNKVVILGYPARDSRIPDQELMSHIYGDIYDVKRMAPGEIITEETFGDKSLIAHDCTTLGGNSGSLLLDLDDGTAAGLHFSGSYGEANYAIPAPVIAERLSTVK